MGCGSGRNLLYLAAQGHFVKGIDYNLDALNSIQEIAKKEQLSSVSTRLHDLNHAIKLESKHYYLVFSTVTLQFLNPQHIPRLLLDLQKITKFNGYHVLVVPVQSELYPLPNFFTYLPQKEELYQFYQNHGWSILEYKESVGHLHKCDESGRQISGVFAFLVAQNIR